MREGFSFKEFKGKEWERGWEREKEGERDGERKKKRLRETGFFSFLLRKFFIIIFFFSSPLSVQRKNNVPHIPHSLSYHYLSLSFFVFCCKWANIYTFIKKKRENSFLSLARFARWLSQPLSSSSLLSSPPTARAPFLSHVERGHARRGHPPRLRGSSTLPVAATVIAPGEVFLRRRDPFLYRAAGARGRRR